MVVKYVSKKEKFIAIIDYNMSNLFSVQAACANVGIKTIITNDYEQIMKSEAIILPGVGAYSEAMDKIKKLKLDYAIQKFLEKGKMIFGICLGMQLFFENSYEFGEVKGLGLIKGSVVKFDYKSKNEFIKTPHLGWNKINLKKNSVFFEGIHNQSYMYFVHSYYVNPTISSNIVSTTNYGGNYFCSSIEKENIFAVQFHPEKSGIDGLKMYLNIKQKLKIE